MELNIILPSKPRVISEDEFRGSYEIEGLYPGYGQTLGNSLRRIILSSTVGAAITSIKVAGATHEFSTLPGVKEDVMAIIMNLKKVNFKLSSEEPQTASIKFKGAKTVTAADLKVGGQVEVTNPEAVIANLTDKNASLEIELVLEKGVGYVPREVLKLSNPPVVGTIILDASFTPIRRVSYEVENMRVGNRTDYNRLRLNIETNGNIGPRVALEKSIEIMIEQLKAIIGFREEEEEEEITAAEKSSITAEKEKAPADTDLLKTRVEDLDLSPRVARALAGAGIRTIGGLTRKRESDLAAISGLGDKGIDEINELLAKHDLGLKD